MSYPHKKFLLQTRHNDCKESQREEYNEGDDQRRDFYSCAFDQNFTRKTRIVNPNFRIRNDKLRIAVVVACKNDKEYNPKIKIWELPSMTTATNI